VTQSYVETFRKFSLNGAGGAGAPEWVRALRHVGLRRFVELGFPSMKNEDWHFTSVAPIADRDFTLLTAPSGDVRRADLEPFGFGSASDAWHTAVFVNGRFAPEVSRLGRLPDGVRILPLTKGWTEAPELARRVGTIASPEKATFTALNTAFMYDGAIVQIADDTTVEQPIHLLFAADRHGANAVWHPRNLVVAGRNAKAAVIESYVALTDMAYFTNAVTEVAVGEGATLTHYKLQREAIKAFHVGTIEAVQAKDSHYQSFSFAVGGDLSRTNIATLLDGEGCGATLNGLYMLDGAQHCDHQTRIEHAQPNCFSREVYIGILDGRSHGVFNGKVYVRPIAQKTDGKQTNKNLLLSEHAQVDTKPQLEIFADDVKCTHGAAVGQIDQMALFYMKSRGLGADEARRLLTYAFAAGVLETIEVQAVKEGLEAMALARYAGAGE
jgi:Fe-S cluster assembly protein SufD